MGKTAFLFPGQGAQYPGMGKDFFEYFAEVRETFEEASDILGRDLGKLILEGPEATLTQTENSQVAIYVVSIAIMRAVQREFPEMKAHVCAGLSLGEYTALTAAGYLRFEDGVKLVQHRGQFMSDACEATQGTMAVVLGLDGEIVEAIVNGLNMPNDLWAANFNCPGQVVLSGTLHGIEAGTAAAKARGAKRVLPLQVHGAFHSGLMQRAKERLEEHVELAHLHSSTVPVVMNVTGEVVTDIEEIKRLLIKQVTSPVRWEKGIHKTVDMGVTHFVEMGCGKTLGGFNKRILSGAVPTTSIEKVSDLKEVAYG